MADTLTAPPPAAPAAAPAPAPAATPDNMGLRPLAGSEAFGDLESMATEDGKPDTSPSAPPTAPEAPKDTPRQPDGKFAKAEPKPDPKAKVDTAPEVATEKLAPKQLREAYEALKAKHKALESEHTTLKTKATTPADDPEKKTLAERLAAREKRLQEIEEELKFTDYTKSEEYKEKFEKPFVDAYLSGRARIAQLKVVEKRNDMDEVIQPARQATADDFDALMKIADDGEASDWAHDKFGNRAPIALFARERAQELNSARTKAVEDYRKNGSEREKARSMEAQSFQKTMSEAIDRHMAQASEKFPKWFKPDPTDTKGNEILERDQHIVARVVANGKPLKDGETQWTPEQFAGHLAAIRHKAAAFNRLARQHTTASKRIAELEAELAGYKKSTPGSGDGKGTSTPQDNESLEGALSALDKLAK